MCAFVFVLLGLAGAALPAAAPTLETAQRMMVYGIWLNLLLCFFNLIPIPPLDGSHLLYHALPPRAGRVVPGPAAVRATCRCFALLFVFRRRMDVPADAGATA